MAMKTCKNDLDIKLFCGSCNSLFHVKFSAFVRGNILNIKIIITPLLFNYKTIEIQKISKCMMGLLYYGIELYKSKDCSSFYYFAFVICL